MEDHQGNLKRYMSAAEAAEALGVSRATLYSYVSRGLIRSEPVAHNARRRRYRGEDVQRLIRRKAHRREPSLVAEQALHFGAPVLTSSLTLIDGQRLFYRGEDALQLAQSREVEEVAWFMWAGEWGKVRFDRHLRQGPGAAGAGKDMTMLERFQCALPQLEAHDVSAFDLSPSTVRSAGARILARLTAIAGGRSLSGGLVNTLVKGWKIGDENAKRLLSAALILCADHELNVSSFTARCVASAGSTPYQVVLAGLAALQGTRHGGYTSRVAALLDEVQQPQRARQVLRDRLRRGETIPGFGHPLYSNGDPRARLLLHLIEELAPQGPSAALAQSVAREVGQLAGLRPNVDFALVTLSRLFDLPRDGGLILFALGRTVGWIAHALEQYELGQMIRPRARYHGPLPGAGPESMVAP